MMNERASFIRATLIAPGTTELRFRAPSLRFRPGQYVTITLPQLAHLPIRERFRDFSVASSPEDLPEFSIVYRESESIFKKTIRAFSPGAEVIVAGPKGFFLLPDNETVPVVFLAGGVGITPFLSMTRWLAHTPRAVKPILVYSNTSLERSVALEELRQNPEVICDACFGPLTRDVVQKHADTLREAIVMIAGPSGFVGVAQTLLDEIHVPDTQIMTEEFTGYE